MTTIKIEIKNCKECPHFELGARHSTDGFDSMQDWLCGKSQRMIVGAVEWHEESKIEIPSWCEITCNNFSKEELEVIKIDARHILSCIALSKENKTIRENIINKIN